MTPDWRKNTMTWGKRIVLVLLVMAGLMYLVLSLAARSPESLRKGLEDYLVKSTGHYGEITEMAGVQLVPDVMFDVRGVSVRDREDHDKVYIHAQSAHIGLPLWRMIFGGGTYRVFEIRGLQLATGYLLPKKLSLDFAGITDPDPQSAAALFILDGTYNDRTLLATMEMTRKLTRRGPLYAFASKSLTTFKLGDTEGQGLVSRGLLSVSLEAATVRSGGVTADFTVTGLHEEPLNIGIKGSVEGAGFNVLLTRNGDNVLLSVTPDSDVGVDGCIAIKHLVESILEDFALIDAPSNFIVDLSALELSSSPAKTSEDSQ